ncbi:M23 family metallopeptidase [Pseudoalteromonas mariniglutinosa]|uniref:M23 family metallopeptidase n=1 Tax=Pseudoalteromonas mariniglutinosa TaxID=206042 RepID=UPI00384A7D2C
MNIHIQILALSGLFASSFTVLAEGEQRHEFTFSQQTVAGLKLTSILSLDDSQFVFNNTLLSEDWDRFFALHAPALEDKKEFIMHWAGYASINPKIIIALIEQQSNLVTAAETADMSHPFAALSKEQGFENQLKDVVIQLSQRFYAYKQWQDNPSNMPKSATISTNRIASHSTAATAALVSLLVENQHTQIASTDNGLTHFLATFERLFPESSQQLLLSANSRSLAQDYQSRQAINFAMNLPWPSGYWYSGGAHSNTGSGYPYSSLDFNNGSGGWGSNTPYVQAAHGGTVTRFSGCNIRVTHASGYATNYYHMANLQYSSGDYVQSGAWLGRYANNYNQALCEGGQSSGPHVHFTLLYNGQQVSLQDHFISGHRIDVGNSNYDSDCNRFYFERNGYRTCAWQPLYR